MGFFLSRSPIVTTTVILSGSIQVFRGNYFFDYCTLRAVLYVRDRHPVFMKINTIDEYKLFTQAGSGIEYKYFMIQSLAKSASSPNTAFLLSKTHCEGLSAGLLSTGPALS